MEQAKTAIHLSDLSLPELDQVLKTYPWFSLARKEFFLRMTSLGEEYRNEGLKKAAVYVFSREGLLKEGQKVKAQELEKEKEKQPETFDLNMLEEDFDIQEKEKEVGEEPVIELEQELEVPAEEVKAPIEIKPAEVKAPAEIKKEIRIIGGDYFGREDFDSLKEDGLTTIERFHTIPKTAEITSEIELDADDDFTDEEYYTETLAKVYANQGYYQKASEVYEKLILLYPEKSSYFAALKEDIKKYL